MNMIISIVLVVVMNVCSYFLGYLKKGLDESEARRNTLEDLCTKLDEYTAETFDEKAKAFFDGANWVLDRLYKYEEEH